jgi:cell shape-determining protein MreC
MSVFLTGSTGLAAEISSRYVLEKVEQGFLRLDSETGAMALCSAKAGVWECQPVKDQGLDHMAELARLKTENQQLKARLAELEKSRVQLKLPTDQEVDRMMDVFSKMFDRFLDFAREMDEKTKGGTSL